MRRFRAKRSRKPSLRDQVLGALREEILTCQLKPGTMLAEKELAERFRVSKTPAREALALLVHEGLVEAFPRKGYLVTSVTVQDVHDYFELRMILECAAVQLAAGKLTEEQLQQLEAFTAPENPPESIPQMLDRNFAFHSLIAHASGNQRIARLIEQLLLEMKRLITVGWVPGEHQRLMATLRERDPQRARLAIQDHILTVRDTVMRRTTYNGSGPA